MAEELQSRTEVYTQVLLNPMRLNRHIQARLPSINYHHMVLSE